MAKLSARDACLLGYQRMIDRYTQTGDPRLAKYQRFYDVAATSSWEKPILVTRQGEIMEKRIRGKT